MEPWESALGELKAEAQRVFGPRLRRVVLFGSRARGMATPDSDVDVALVLSGPSDPVRDLDAILDAVFEINLRYGELLAVVPISETDWHQASSPLVMNLHREGVEA